MRKTLLDIVQGILSDMDGDEVNSIYDTEESEQVAKIVRSTYEAIVSHTNWPHTRRAVALIPRSNSEFPTHMKLEDNVKELISVRYNTADAGETRKTYKELKYLDPDDFLRKINIRNNDDSNIIVVIDDSGIELLIKNDKSPEYFTSFDDTNVIFDSFDNSVEATLVEDKFQAQAYIIPSFYMRDDFTPDLPIDAFSMFIEEATSKCQYKLRQFQDVKAEQEATRQSRWMSRKAWRVDGGIRYPDWGRRRNQYRTAKAVNGKPSRSFSSGLSGQ